MAASKNLLEVILDHCPSDADLTACRTLPQPQLDPLSQLEHVARPPMDPRRASTSKCSLTNPATGAHTSSGACLYFETTCIPEFQGVCNTFN